MRMFENQNQNQSTSSPSALPPQETSRHLWDESAASENKAEAHFRSASIFNDATASWEELLFSEYDGIPFLLPRWRWRETEHDFFSLQELLDVLPSSSLILQKGNRVDPPAESGSSQQEC